MCVCAGCVCVCERESVCACARVFVHGSILGGKRADMQARQLSVHAAAGMKRRLTSTGCMRLVMLSLALHDTAAGCAACENDRAWIQRYIHSADQVRVNVHDRAIMIRAVAKRRHDGAACERYDGAACKSLREGCV